MNSTLLHAAETMLGTLHGVDRSFDGVSTDTRTLQSGELFIALSGPNFDGGEFVNQANEKGAAGAVVRSLIKDENSGSAWKSDTRMLLLR